MVILKDIVVYVNVFSLIVFRVLNNDYMFFVFEVICECIFYVVKEL